MKSPVERWTARKLELKRLLKADPTNADLLSQLQAAEAVLETLATAIDVDDIYSYGETAAEIDRSVFDLPSNFNFAELSKPPATNPLEGWTDQNIYGQRQPDDDEDSD